VPEPDHPLSEAAKLLLRHSRVVDLRAAGDEAAAMARHLSRPLPTLATDSQVRECQLMVLLLRERERSRRLLQLLADE
jgi:hypothetical protein